MVVVAVVAVVVAVAAVAVAVADVAVVAGGCSSNAGVGDRQLQSVWMRFLSN